MWIYFMAEALQGVPGTAARRRRRDWSSMRISADTGLAARPGEPNAIFETFMAGHLPAEARRTTAALATGGEALSERRRRVTVLTTSLF